MSKVETMPAQEEWTEVNERLADATPTEILRWGVETFFPRLTMATAFGPEGCILIHLLAEIEPRVRVFNLDTGYQFPETLALRDRIAERYGIEVELVRRRHDRGRVRGGSTAGPLYVVELRPVLPRPQDRPAPPGRGRYDAVDLGDPGRPVGRTGRRPRWWAGTPKFGLVKINPLLSWTQRDVWAFVVANHVPYNPLHDQGYPSIGCWPCTQAGGRRRGRAGRALGGPGQDRVRPALAGQQPALSRHGRRGRRGQPPDEDLGEGGICVPGRPGPGPAGPRRPPVRIREISEAHGIPERYLVQILLQLKGAGLVASTRGASGGYRLARPAAEISLGEVLTRDRRPRRAAPRAAEATGRPPRSSPPSGSTSAQAERSVLDQTSIAQLAERTSPREWVI